MDTIKYDVRIKQNRCAILVRNRKAIQDQIDVLMKKREAIRNAALFAEWRDKK